MAYVGFERPDSAVAAAGCGLAKRLRKGPDFDGIADDRPGSMGLDVGDVRGADASEIQSFGNDLGLAFNARGQITDLARAIIVNCRSENDGADMVAIFECIFKASQYDNPQATSKDSSARSCIEGTAVAVARKNLSFAVDIALTMRDFDGNPACQRQIALVIEQTLAGKMNRDKRSGARGLHVNAGSAQVQLVGNARGQNIFVVAGLFELE